MKFIFQPAEETGYGAKAIAETDVLDDVKAILGFHNYPTLNIGEFAIKSGPITSTVDRLNLKFTVKVHMLLNQNKVMIQSWYLVN